MTEIAVSRLGELEEVIQHGLETFVEVGQALATIRDERLYSHKTFEDYCRERWEFSDSRARQLVAAAETVTTVTVEGLPAPRNEGVARELVALRSEPDVLRETWADAVERYGEKPTAAQVKEVVAEHRRQPEARSEPEYTSCPTCGHRVRADKPLRPRSTQ